MLCRRYLPINVGTHRSAIYFGITDKDVARHKFLWMHKSKGVCGYIIIICNMVDFEVEIKQKRMLSWQRRKKLTPYSIPIPEKRCVLTLYFPLTGKWVSSTD